MNNDLISRRALMQELRGNVLVDVTPELEEAVSNQPSICDIDEIATQLEACSSILKEIFIAIKGQIPKKASYIQRHKPRRLPYMRRYRPGNKRAFRRLVQQMRAETGLGQTIIKTLEGGGQIEKSIHMQPIQSS